MRWNVSRHGCDGIVGKGARFICMTLALVRPFLSYAGEFLAVMGVHFPGPVRGKVRGSVDCLGDKEDQLYT